MIVLERKLLFVSGESASASALFIAMLATVTLCNCFIYNYFYFNLFFCPSPLYISQGGWGSLCIGQYQSPSAWHFLGIQLRVIEWKKCFSMCEMYSFWLDTTWKPTNLIRTEYETMGWSIKLAKKFVTFFHYHGSSSA